jgi:hypothetical protein
MILALLNFLCPVGNVLLSAHLEHITFLQYVRTGTFSDLFAVLLAPWIGAFAIFSVKKWSYPVFMTVMVYQAASLFYQAHSFPNILDLKLVFLITFLNVGFASYFLNSRVRTVYYDQRLKWWESQPRYEVQIPCSLNVGDGKSENASILNISVGGVFLKSPYALSVGSEVCLAFESLGIAVSTTGKVLYFRNEGYGINFIPNAQSLDQIKALIKLLKHQGASPIQGRFSKIEDFRNWAKTKALKPAGWMPEVRIEKMLEEEKKSEDAKKTVAH